MAKKKSVSLPLISLKYYLNKLVFRNLLFSGWPGRDGRRDYKNRISRQIIIFGIIVSIYLLINNRNSLFLVVLLSKSFNVNKFRINRCWEISQKNKIHRWDIHRKINS